MFISFEGIDGSGKSTQLELLVSRMRESGYQVEVFREPGGTPLAERIRELLLDPAYSVDPFAELLLFSAARAQLVASSIRPALARGRIVICDRFYDSTTAYQGGGRELQDIEWLDDFHQRVTGGLKPDRTYLLDISPGKARRRRTERPGQEDRMERVETSFYKRVITAYRGLAHREPQRFCVLDATLPVEALHGKIWTDVEQMTVNMRGTRDIGYGSSNQVSGD